MVPIQGMFIKYQETLFTIVFIDKLNWKYNYFEDKNNLSRFVNFHSDWYHYPTAAVVMVTSCNGNWSKNWGANINILVFIVLDFCGLQTFVPRTHTHSYAVIFKTQWILSVCHGRGRPFSLLKRSNIKKITAQSAQLGI